MTPLPLSLIRLPLSTLPSGRLLFAIALWLVVATGCVLIAGVWRHRQLPGARSFLAIVAAGTIWALGDALHLFLQGEQWVTFAYLGIGLLPVAWFAFCLEYTGRGGILTRRSVLALALIPALTIPAVATNHLHHWMWVTLSADGGTKVLYGPAYLVSTGYGYLLFLGGNLLLVLNLAEVSGAPRRQLILILFAALFPWIANLLQLLDVYPRSAPNPTPLAFVVSSVVFYFGMFRLQLLEILPVAQRNVIRQMERGLVVLEAQGRVVSVNPAAEAILGVRDAEVHGQAFREVVRPWPELAEAAASDGTRQREVVRLQSTGTSYFEIEGSVVRDEAGRTLGRFLLLLDITARKLQMLEREGMLQQMQQTNERLQAEIVERRKLELSLRRTEASMRTFFDNSPVGIYRTTPDGQILMANPALVRLLGFESFEQLARRNLEVEGYEPRYDRHRFKEVMEREGRVVAWESPWLRRDGTILRVRENAHAIRDENGAILFYEGMIEDISAERNAQRERQELEQRMQEVQKLESLGVLAGGIAHDFNNLLTVITGSADVALEGLPSEAPTYEPLREIRKTAARAADLCQQMLAYAGRGRFVVRPFRLPELIEEMTPLLRSSVSKNAALRFDLAPGGPAVRGDVTQIRQVILNLVINASEAIGEADGEIVVSAGCLAMTAEQLRQYYLGENLPEGRYVWLQVADTGCGMDASTSGRMFEPFFTTKVTGRGLGLSAVLGIARSHGGALRVTSEVGGGTTLRVVLPALAGEPEAEEPRRNAPEAAWKGGGTLLLVDDEEAVRQVGKRLIESCGFSVITARDGREALDVFRQRGTEIVLVLLDQTMPRLNGRETLEGLRRLNPQVRVILMSGYSETEIAGRHAGGGREWFLQKPFTKEALLQVVRACLR